MALLTRKEVAVQLHVCQMTVVRLGRGGHLDEVRVGKRAIRIDSDSVVRHLAAGRVTHERTQAA